MAVQLLKLSLSPTHTHTHTHTYLKQSFSVINFFLYRKLQLFLKKKRIGRLENCFCYRTNNWNHKKSKLPLNGIGKQLKLCKVKHFLKRCCNKKHQIRTRLRSFAQVRNDYWNRKGTKWSVQPRNTTQQFLPSSLP